MSQFVKRTLGSRGWVYAQSIRGQWIKLREWTGALLIGLMVVIPFLRIGGYPLILLDIPHRRFILFGTVFWPHDIWLLFFLIAGAAVALLLFTALFGRVWCGYACPQTVFMHHVFFKIERWIEGDRFRRQRLDKRPWDLDKFLRKLIKHTLFIVFSSLVAHIFLAYFIDIRELMKAIVQPSAEYRNSIVAATLFTAAFYLDFGFLREQFCNYLCPYARFQSALMDDESLIVSYDPSRGEPRGYHRSSGSNRALGDCVDCKKCVVVCPQGIDIRNGVQLECVHCALCIDACDPVMEKLGRPKGLIRYASEKELEGGKKRLFRSRTLVYGALLIMLSVGLVYELRHRRLIEATLIRPPGAVMQQTADGSVSNHFRLQLVNKDVKDRELALAVDNSDQFRVVTARNPIPIDSGSLLSVEVFVVSIGSQDHPTGKIPVTLKLMPDEGERETHLPTQLIVPIQAKVTP